MEHFYIFLVNFWDLYNYFTWVASSLANIMKKWCSRPDAWTPDWAFDESWRKGKKRGEGGREEILFLSCPFPPPSSHFFALFPTHNKRGSACYVGYWYTTRPPFHCFGRPAIQPQRLMWKRLLAHFIQAFLCSVFFVFFNLHWITGQL